MKAVLGPNTKVTYAADWSEYFGHHPQDGSGDVYFHLDPLWASPSIDAIGIDLYWPLSDWRDGYDHADAIAGVHSIYDLNYLKSNIAGGEGYDWYYASAGDRASQIRTPITDGQGKPWIFRYKDLKSWWRNPHYNRPGGIEQSTPTEWVPESKPVWFMEIGCPAIDKGANQPNVFVDPKSSETVLPYFSNGQRDDFIQRRYLQALIEAFDPEHPGAMPDLNPESSVYEGRMVDPGRIHVYTWDARPFPAFPSDTHTWGDSVNWHRGHWINGRVTSAPVGDLLACLLDDAGFAHYETSALKGILPGYTIDRVMSPREAIQPLELAYFFDAVESGDKIVFRPRGACACNRGLDRRPGRRAAGKRPFAAHALRRRSCPAPRKSPTSRQRMIIGRPWPKHAAWPVPAVASAQLTLRSFCKTSKLRRSRIPGFLKHGLRGNARRSCYRRAGSLLSRRILF